MGKCIKCGRKAKNSYKYYIGNVIDKKVDNEFPQNHELKIDELDLLNTIVCKM